MKKSFRNNWKLYGLNLFGYQIIPCYYDVKRFFTNLSKYKHKFNFVNFSYLVLAFRSMFDTTIKL